jgi:hypothetical protein
VEAGKPVITFSIGVVYSLGTLLGLVKNETGNIGCSGHKSQCRCNIVWCENKVIEIRFDLFYKLV